MTALIYSLALGFLIFLSISSRMQISVSSHEELKNKRAYYVVELEAQYRFDLDSMEKLFQANSHIIEEFSWVSASIDSFDESNIVKAYLNNHANYVEYP